MLEIIFYIFIYLLAFYGAVAITITIMNSFQMGTRECNPNIRLSLIVRDSEDRIEGVIRGVFSGELLRKLMISQKLTVLDLGSKDDTRRILEKLALEYEDLTILDESEKEKVFNLPY